jgi:hypothetical protein
MTRAAPGNLALFVNFVSGAFAPTLFEIANI